MPRNPVLQLFRVLAGSCQSKLRQQVQFLQAENEILRSKIPGPIRVTTAERARLIRLGKPLGPAIRSLVSIVWPETFLKWVREAKKKPKRKAPARRSGWPRTPEEIRTIVLRIAGETGFGYTRILGELRKLGIGGVSRSTVVNILKEKGLPTGPQRGECTRAKFLKRHAKTLWACDFLTTRMLTPKGMCYAFSLVFVHPGTCCAHVSRATTNPDAAWMHEAVRWFAESVPEGMARPGLLLRDRDGKFAAGDGGFDAALASAGISAVRLVAAPSRSLARAKAPAMLRLPMVSMSMAPCGPSSETTPATRCTWAIPPATKRTVAPIQNDPSGGGPSIFSRASTWMRAFPSSRALQSQPAFTSDSFCLLTSSTVRPVNCSSPMEQRRIGSAESPLQP